MLVRYFFCIFVFSQFALSGIFSFFVFLVFLLEQGWVGDLEVHQQVATGAVDVATVTLKQDKIICIFISFANFQINATVTPQRNSQPSFFLRG